MQEMQEENNTPHFGESFTEIWKKNSVSNLWNFNLYKKKIRRIYIRGRKK